MLPVLRRSSPLHRQFRPSFGRSLIRQESTNSAEHAAKKSEIPSASSPSRSPIGTLLVFVTLTAGGYVGGLFLSEKVPEVKSVYDKLPYTKEARQLVGLLPPDGKSSSGAKSPAASLPSLPSLPSFSSIATNIQDLVFGKDFGKEPEKKAVPAPKKPSNDNAPFIPKEGVKVVIIDPATEKKAPETKEVADDDAASLKAPPMNSQPQIKEVTGPLIGLESEEEEEVVVAPIVKDINELNKDIATRNQEAVNEVLEKSKKNLRDADENIKDLQEELETLLKKTDSILTSARTAELQDQISKLRSKLEELAAEKVVAEQKFKLELEELQATLQKEAQAKFDALQQKHQQDLKEEAARHDQDLAQQYRNQENLYNLRVKEELQKQEQALESLFKEEIDMTLKKERAERMSKIEKLSATAKVLEQVSRKQGITEVENAAVRKVLLAITGFQDAIENKRPFAKELAYLKTVSAAFPLVQQALETIDPSLAEKGVATAADLSTRFVSVKKAVSEAAYVSSTGGLWSVSLSWVLSQFSLSQSGLVEGSDVGAILARSEYHLLRGDIESATREMNQLKGWQKKLTQDWMQASRQYLEVHQTLTLVEAEISHQLLG